jgi:hypothetical protein
MCYIVDSHLVQSLGAECGATPRAAIEHELLLSSEFGLVSGTGGIDLKFKQATRDMTGSPKLSDS